MTACLVHIQKVTGSIPVPAISHTGESPVNKSLSGKVDGFANGTYAAVTGLAYDATNKKLGIKVGADAVIPFSGAKPIKFVFSSAGANTNTATGIYTFPVNCTANISVAAYADGFDANSKIGPVTVSVGSYSTSVDWTNAKVKTLKLENIRVKAGQAMTIWGVTYNNNYWVLCVFPIAYIED